MRLPFLALILLALVLPALPQARRSRPAAQQPPSEEDRKAIDDLQSRDILANIALDTDKIMALRTDNVVYLVPGRAPLVGRQAVRDYLEEIRKQLADWDMQAYEENWQEVRVLGEYAYQWGAINIRAKKTGETRESAATRNVVRVCSASRTAPGRSPASSGTSSCPSNRLKPRMRQNQKTDH